MSQPASTALQQEIALELQVTQTFDAQQEIERRVAFLAERLTSTGLRSLVLGISGGVDSTTAGRLCQLAVERARAAGHDATFYAMRLPYGVQADEKDAQLALGFIEADRVLTVDVKPASDAALETALAGGTVFRDAHHQDFVQGNIKARQRMIAQYAVAGAHDGLVVGTDHAAEAVSGFFTKFGDGAADLVPLTGLTKRRVRAVADVLGAPAELVWKTPRRTWRPSTRARPTRTRSGSRTTTSTTSWKASRSMSGPSTRSCAATASPSTSVSCRSRRSGTAACHAAGVRRRGGVVSIRAHTRRPSGPASVPQLETPGTAASRTRTSSSGSAAVWLSTTTRSISSWSATCRLIRLPESATAAPTSSATICSTGASSGRV